MSDIENSGELQVLPPVGGDGGSIIVTGAAGFIGSCMVQFLNELGYTNLILVDEFNRDEKIPNLNDKQFTVEVEREDLFKWLEQNKPVVDFVIHLGARTDTTEFDYAFQKNVTRIVCIRRAPPYFPKSWGVTDHPGGADLVSDWQSLERQQMFAIATYCRGHIF